MAASYKVSLALCISSVKQKFIKVHMFLSGIDCLAKENDHVLIIMMY